MDFTWIFRLLNTYLATLTTILLLTGTFGIVNNGKILTVETGDRKYLEKKYNDL